MKTLSLESWKYDKPVIEIKENPVTGEKNEIFTGKFEQADFDVKEMLSNMLRSPGVLAETADTVEAIMLGRKIIDVEGDSIELDDRQVEVTKKVLDKFLKATHEGQARLGGTAHEEIILRIHAL